MFKRNINRLFIIFCLMGTNSVAQVDSIVFCLSNKGIPGLYLSKLNVNNGAVTYISPNVIGNGVGNFNAAIDPYLQRYYFFDGPYQITTLDLSTGTLVTSAVLTSTATNSFAQLIFNASDSILYGLGLVSNPPEVYLNKIDPNTGVITKISNTSLSQGVNGFSATLDPFTKTYYYINENNWIMGIDLISGNVKTSSQISNVNGVYFDLMRYNPVDKIIYGLARKPGPPEVYLARIDPSTGVVTNISGWPVSTSIYASGSTLDPCNNRFYYESEFGLTALDCNSGSLINTFTPTSQILEMRYNYRCHLNFTLSGIAEKQNDNTIQVFPNPAGGFIGVSGLIAKSPVAEIINSLGEVIIRTVFNSEINVSHLASGVYTLRVISEQQNCYTKFVKE